MVAQLRPAGELARFGVNLDLLAVLDEERHSNLEPGLERGNLGHAAAGRVSPARRAQMRSRSAGRRELEADRVASKFLI